MFGLWQNEIHDYQNVLIYVIHKYLPEHQHTIKDWTLSLTWKSNSLLSLQLFSAFVTRKTKYFFIFLKEVMNFTFFDAMKEYSLILLMALIPSFSVLHISSVFFEVGRIPWLMMSGKHWYVL